MKKLRILAAGAAVLAAALFTMPVYALDPPPKPTDIPVVDQTNTLNDEQKQALAAKIKAERDKTNNQVAILMIPSLEGDAIEDYSLRVARGWGIGGSERDSGVLLLVAKNDRKLRIEVGYGLEGALPDARASRIIRDQISPQFRSDKYYEGIDAGVTSIIAAVNGEADTSPPESAATFRWSKLPWEVIVFAPVILLSWLGSILGRTKSWWAGGIVGGGIGAVLGIFFGFLFVGVAAIIGLALLGLLFDWLVSRNYQKHLHDGDNPAWWAGGPWLGGGGNSGSSGGFGGFGGGSFGGGGSSGSW